ncbi:hypothetical protein [Variovorax paradoxus]|uniref:hypothetical protein n=1 Tax=Variovorax paradoxus TaxID=34073 RepID=UPI000A416B43|nr:hypothetical protein [Variovorax paradoxus]
MTIKLTIAAVILALAAALGIAIYQWGGSAERTETLTDTVKANTKAEKKQKAKTRTDLARAAHTGAAREQDRAALDALFQRLDKEANDAPTAAHDSYVLPDDRLRIWRAANAGPGPDRGEPSSESDRAASAPAAAGHGGDSGAGVQPPRGGEGVSQPGLADVPPVGASADADSGV